MTAQHTNYPYCRTKYKLVNSYCLYYWLQLCMPDGLRFTKNLTDLTQKHIHTFCITKGNGLHLYGTSLTYYELTTDVKILNSFEAFQSKYLENIRIQLHSKQDYSFSRTKDKLYAPKCLCFITPLPIFCPLKVYLEQLYAITVSQTPSELPVASYIFNLLYEVTLPSPGKTLLFKGMCMDVLWHIFVCCL